MKRIMSLASVSFFILLLSNLPVMAICEGDLNCDGVTDGTDLATFAADFGTTGCGTCDDVITRIDELEARIAQLEALLASVSFDTNTIRFTGVNVQIVSGSGSTDGTVNGLGNLIVGYDEDVGDNDKSGSHNLVVGEYHTYNSYGGFVAGRWNKITERFSSVCGGASNTASGWWSSVSGGVLNTADGTGNSVSGGIYNTASANYSSVSGGEENSASHRSSSVSGGYNNQASGAYSSVSGGYNNQASGDYSSVSGEEGTTVVHMIRNREYINRVIINSGAEVKVTELPLSPGKYLVGVHGLAMDTDWDNITPVMWCWFGHEPEHTESMHWTTNNPRAIKVHTTNIYQFTEVSTDSDLAFWCKNNSQETIEILDIDMWAIAVDQINLLHYP